LVGIVDMTLFF